MMKKYLFILSILYFACVPIDEEQVSPYADSDESFIEEECDEPCELLISFGSTNYTNQDYSGAVENYRDAIICGCSRSYPEDIFEWLGRSYIQLGEFQKAEDVFIKGIKYLPDDIALLKLAAWSAGKYNNFENQIYHYQVILDAKPKDIESLEALIDVYRKLDRYDEELNVIDMLLKVDSSNKKAIAEKKAVFNILGKDESIIDKQRWENNPSNIQYGHEYINSLLIKEDYPEVVQVCLKLLNYDKYNTKTFNMLSQAYINLFEYEKAVDILLTLFKLEKNDYSVAIEISKVYQNMEDFKSAYDWANKAVSFSSNNGETLFQRAEILFSLGEFCSNETLTFNDKIVFELSWQDYSEAVSKGYRIAMSRRDFLEENSITTSRDWFLQDEKIAMASPTGECYNWIKRSIKRK